MKKVNTSAVSKVRRAASASVPPILSIVIDEEFSRLIPPLTPEEQSQLEASLKAYGCRDPLVLWAGMNILLDGHHRYPLCQQHCIQFQTVSIELANREAAEDWIDANQLGRRNLNPDQFSLLLGRRYNRAKKRPGGTGANQHKPQQDQIDPSANKTAKTLAIQHGVGEATVKRAGKFAEAVEKVKAVDPEIERKVGEGKAPAKRAVVKAAELIEQDPDQAKAVLEGTVAVAQIEGVSQSAAADTTTNATGSDDSSEMIVQRAVEANEAVLALGDTVASVSVKASNRFRALLVDLSSRWLRLFPTKVSSKSAVEAPVRSSNPNAA